MKPEKCLEDGCNSKSGMKGYCDKHYIRLTTIINNLTDSEVELKNKLIHKLNILDEMYPKKEKKPILHNIREKYSAFCCVDGCNRPHHSKGYCERHSRQIEKYGRLTPELESKTLRPLKLCSVEGCNNIHLAKGYCNKHYIEFRRYGKIL
jgi:hypothetical protein